MVAYRGMGREEGMADSEEGSELVEVQVGEHGLIALVDWQAMDVRC